MSDGAVVALDIDILLRLAWLNMVQSDALGLSPFHKFTADIFRAVVDTDGERVSPPFGDLVEARTKRSPGSEKSTSMPSPSRLKSSSFCRFFTKVYKDNPEAKSLVKRSATDGDLVFIHSHVSPSPNAAGLAIIDVFKVLDGKLVDHWDAIQDVPKGAANKNSMF